MDDVGGEPTQGRRPDPRALFVVLYGPPMPRGTAASNFSAKVRARFIGAAAAIASSMVNASPLLCLSMQVMTCVARSGRARSILCP